MELFEIAFGKSAAFRGFNKVKILYGARWKSARMFLYRTSNVEPKDLNMNSECVLRGSKSHAVRYLT